MKQDILFVSIDAVRPDLLFEADKHQLQIPFLKSLIEKGIYSDAGVKTVFPALTYPCHISMFSGLYPDEHGTSNNEMFDPEGKHRGVWDWFYPEKTQSMWKIANECGYQSFNVTIPASIGGGAEYDLPEYWIDGTDFNTRYYKYFSHPDGIYDELIKSGIDVPGFIDLDDEGDKKRKELAMWLIKNKIDSRPFFLSLYQASYDWSAHHHGTFSKEAITSLEKADWNCRELFDLITSQRGREPVVCIVSDHGMSDEDKIIKVNSIFAEKGIIRVENEKLISWDAWCSFAHGTAEIRFNTLSEERKNEIKEIIINEIVSEKNGIKRFYDKEELKKYSTFPDADLVLEALEGYRFDNSFTPGVVEPDKKYCATHGWSNENSDMNAIFVLYQPGNKTSVPVKGMDLVDYLPTIAEVMGHKKDSFRGKSVI